MISGVSVVTDAAGFQTAKDAAAAVSDALVDAALALARGRLVSPEFPAGAGAKVEAGAMRRDRPALSGAGRGQLNFP